MSSLQEQQETQRIEQQRQAAQQALQQLQSNIQKTQDTRPEWQQENLTAQNISATATNMAKSHALSIQLDGQNPLSMNSDQLQKDCKEVNQAFTQPSNNSQDPIGDLSKQLDKFCDNKKDQAGKEHQAAPKPGASSSTDKEENNAITHKHGAGLVNNSNDQKQLEEERKRAEEKQEKKQAQEKQQKDQLKTALRMVVTGGI